ncbi:ParB N-terminal domain-containing protein [Natronococcus roseus]|uniref:ParB N-terminal domain-containing protein n=1 Tax=Natronococcus roseus TaxID=1052014 RepID=UPI00374CE0AB
MTKGENVTLKHRSPEVLNPHSVNTKVYGDQDDLDESFLSSIREQGVLEPIVIDTEETIISGHRRVAAASKVGLGEVPVRIEEFDSELKKREALVHHNRQREKTFSQKMREAEMLEEIERERAQERQGKRTDLVENQSRGNGADSEYGKTRDKVSEEVGIGSGRTYDKAKQVWEAAQNGDTVAQHEVERIDNGKQSIHGAFNQVKRRLDNNRGETQSEDESESSDSDSEDETLNPDELVLSAHVGTNDKIFPEVIDLHVDDGAAVADATYGNGTFWKRVPSGKYDLRATDINPAKSPDSDEGIDCCDLPYENGELDCIVLDPPYAEGFYDSDRSNDDESTYWIKNRYADAADGELTYHEAVLHLYCEAGREAHRVLGDGGKLIVKVQDEVSRNEQRLTHIEITNYYEDKVGFTAEDLFVVVRSDTPVSPNIKRQRRARKNHSYFLVFKKCENGGSSTDLVA